MTLVAAAVCPHPPLLVADLAAGAAAELDGLRAACRQALKELAEADPELLVVVGSGEETRDLGGEGRADFSGYGPGPVIGEGPTLPLALAAGRYLLAEAAWTPETRFQAVRPAAEAPESCKEIGERLAATRDRVALLAMGDGTARLTEKAPGYIDERAAGHREQVARAFAEGDPAALAALDPDLAADLLAAGRAAWQVLGGAAAGREWDARIHYDDAPYGVAYLVAVWR